MPRSYGITNTAPYAAAPTVGSAGDTYYNTANKSSYVSDGTSWNSVYPGLPAPTSSSTLTTFTDPSGEIWVAQSTVNSGAWARANNALFSYVIRANAYTTAANSDFAWDTVSRDTYGLHSLSTHRFTLPLPGLYDLNCQIPFNAGAAAQKLTIGFANNTLTFTSTIGIARAAETTYVQFRQIVYSSASTDTLRTTVDAAYGIFVGGLGVAPCWCVLKYVGTG